MISLQMFSQMVTLTHFNLGLLDYIEGENNIYLFISINSPDNIKTRINILSDTYRRFCILLVILLLYYTLTITLLGVCFHMVNESNSYTQVFVRPFVYTCYFYGKRCMMNDLEFFSTQILSFVFYICTL
jgi:hypothetical protein